MDRRDIELVRTLQDGELFLTERPFHEVARCLGWEVEEVLRRSRRLQEEGFIRKFCAFLAPAGSIAGSISTRSSLAVCDIADYKAEELGALISEHPMVSYCHIRPRFEGFPFNLYATVRSSTEDGLAQALREIQALAAPYSCRALRAVLELKRSAPVYFPLRPGS